MNGDLNDIIRQQGEPTYYTPPTVYGNLIENHDGGQVTIINPPFESQQPKKPRRKTWIKKWRAFGLYFAIANCRLKRRDTRDFKYMEGHTQKQMCEIKGRIYKRNGGKCPMCGKPFDISKLENHHVLPYGRFPELSKSSRNIELLCHRCHREIHNNPFLNIRMMQRKAAELGIDLRDKYEMNDCL